MNIKIIIVTGKGLKELKEEREERKELKDTDEKCITRLCGVVRGLSLEWTSTRRSGALWTSREFDPP